MDHHHHHHHLYHVHHANGHVSNGIQYFNSPRGTFLLPRSPPSPSSLTSRPVTPGASSPPYQVVNAPMIDPFAGSMRKFSDTDQDCQSLPGPSSQSVNYKASLSHLPSVSHRKMPSVDKNDPNYLQRRSRNNEAVKKSREKKKKESEQVHKEVQCLERKNKELKIKLMKQEASYRTLKDLYETACGKMDLSTEESLFQRQD